MTTMQQITTARQLVELRIPHGPSKSILTELLCREERELRLQMEAVVFHAATAERFVIHRASSPPHEYPFNPARVMRRCGQQLEAVIRTQFTHYSSHQKWE